MASECTVGPFSALGVRSTGMALWPLGSLATSWTGLGPATYLRGAWPMTTFGEEVTIDERRLVLRDGSGDEIARLDQSGNLVVHGDVLGRRAEILRFLAGVTELTVGATGAHFEVDLPEPAEDLDVWLPGSPGTIRVVSDKDPEAILLRGSDATV